VALVLIAVGANGQSGSGRTTRYWDCCKPSCGWDGKGPVTRPVLCCGADGVAGVGVNEQSVCNNGPSHTCTNNAPWTENDVGYGFVAAHLRGQQEQDWCCACYELTFTSGPINGKRMIVQITNTGGDLGEDHFDILIPGGGVGLFNGCSSQWGAPADGWGDRYGGVRSIAECEQLPVQLRDGCRWRFQWFAGADNPNINFRKVDCPSQLTSRSQCSRTAMSNTTMV